MSERYRLHTIRKRVRKFDPYKTLTSLPWGLFDARCCHQMEAFSALLALCEGSHQSPADSPYKGQWCGALISSSPSHNLNQYWNILNWTPRYKLQWNLNRNSYIFIQENAFKDVVCEMAVILYSSLLCHKHPLYICFRNLCRLQSTFIQHSSTRTLVNGATHDIRQSALL